MKVFGDIYESYVNRLSEMVSSRKKLPGRLIKETISMIKNDPALEGQYRLYSTINSNIPESHIRVVISDLCREIGKFGSDKINESNARLFNHINNRLDGFCLMEKKIHSEINDLIFTYSVNTPKKIIERVTMSENIIKYLLENRVTQTNDESIYEDIVPNELLITVITEKIKNKYGDNEDITAIMEAIISGDSDKMKSVFNKYKEKSLESIDNIFESSDVDVKNKLLNAKLKIMGMDFSIDKFKNDLKSMIKLQETLCVNE